MKYIITIILILLIIVPCMGCVTVTKNIDVYVANPVIIAEIEP